jgi:hypothetical protein
VRVDVTKEPRANVMVSSSGAPGLSTTSTGNAVGGQAAPATWMLPVATAGLPERIASAMKSSELRAALSLAITERWSRKPRAIVPATARMPAMTRLNSVIDTMSSTSVKPR